MRLGLERWRGVKLASVLLAGQGIKHSLIYLFTQGLSGLIPFLMIPVIVHRVSPDVYGVYSLYIGFLGVLSPVLALGASVLLRKLMVSLTDLELAGFISALLLAVGIFVLLCLLLFYFFAKPLQHLMGGIGLKWLYLALFIGYARFVADMVMALLNGRFQAVRYGLWTIGIVSPPQLSVLICIAWWTPTWQHMVLVLAGAHLIILGLSLSWLWREQRYPLSVKVTDLLRILRVGLPLAMQTAVLVAINVNSRFFIMHQMGAQSAAVYTVAAQLSMAVLFACNALNLTWTPWFFQQINQGAVGACHVRYVLWGVLGLIGLIVLIFAGIGWTILPLFHWQSYQAVLSCAPWLGLAFGLQGMYNIVSTYLYQQERVMLVLGIILCAGGCNIVLNHGLVKVYGLQGGAWAMSVSFLVALSLTAYAVYSSSRANRPATASLI